VAIPQVAPKAVSARDLYTRKVVRRILRMRPVKITDVTLGSGAEVVPRRRFEERSSPALVSLSAVTVGVLVALGVGLRLAYYLSNPGLSSDEAALALNLMHRSYTGLFHQLDVNQAAPPGFLLLQKLAIHVFGPSPYALRLFPLAGGIGALLLFYPIAKRLVDRRTALVGLSLFAISDPLIVYAGTNKPYSIDVVVTLVLYAVLLALPEQLGMRESFILALSGAIAVWLSYASVFAVAVIVAVVLIRVGRTLRSVDLAKVLAPIALVVGSFAAAYFLTHASVAHLQRSLGSQPGLLSNSDRPGLLQTYGGIARFLFGVPILSHGIRSAIAIVGAALALVGLVVLVRVRPRVTAVLVIPAGIALIAGATSKYVLAPRTYLFLTPALAILTALGALHLMSRSRMLIALTGTVALAILLASASYATVDRFYRNRHADAVRTLRYLTKNVRQGDALYLHLSAQLDFRYYLECGCFGTVETVRKARSLWPVGGPLSDHPFFRSVPPNLVAGDETGTVPSDYRSDLAPVRGKARVWVLVMDPTARAQMALTQYLFEIGLREDVFPRNDPKATASVALYDLR
jgi:4-amino-4-deoxy-L-arabinose transferase-like glycosyltransferase